METRPDRTAPAGAEALLAQLGWMRALARSLVVDTALADDLAQDVCVAALERRPDTSQPLRGWLATVLRNALRERQRGTERRQAREEDCARHERQPSALNTLARVSTQRELASAVLELREPFREAVLLRYFEELPPRRIARRLGVPTSTVKSRIARGLAQLRMRLEVEPGDNPERLRALAAVAFWPRPSLGPVASVLARVKAGPATVGALAVSTQAKLLLAAGSLAAGVLLVQRLGTPEPASPSPAAAAAAQPAASAENALPVPRESVAATPRRDEAPVEPETAAVAATDPSPLAASPTATATIQGRVLDAYGQGVADVEILAGAVGSDAVARTDSRGQFVWKNATRGATLRVESDAWTTVLTGSAVSRAEPLVIVAPSVELGGWTIDASGSWLADTLVRWELPEDFRARFNEILDYSTEERHSTRTDVSGRFELHGIPNVEGAQLVAVHDEHPQAALDAPPIPTPNLTIVLGRTDPVSAALRGRVLDASGESVAGARVSLAFDTTLTDEAGEFEIPIGEDIETANSNAQQFVEVVTDTLLAVKAGQRPARTIAPLNGSGVPAWPPYVVLQLGGPPLAIAGEVVDENGEPREGVRVWVGDPTFLGWSVTEDGRMSQHLLENEAAGEADASWLSVVSDRNGKFRLSGLEQRSYRVEAMDDLTLRRAVVRDVGAGETSVRIVLPMADNYRRVRGQVVTLSGEPVPGAQIYAMCDSFRTQYRGETISTRHSTTAPTTTDDNGHFELRDVPRDLVYLRVDGEDILPSEFGRNHEGGLANLTRGDVDDVTIPVAARLHFQVELSGTEARQIQALDAEGNRLRIFLFEGNSNRTQETVGLEPGRSATMAVSEAIHEIVVLADGDEIARHDTRLQFGELITVHL